VHRLGTGGTSTTTEVVTQLAVAITKLVDELELESAHKRRPTRYEKHVSHLPAFPQLP
jgi:hypothetical protein